MFCYVGSSILSNKSMLSWSFICTTRCFTFWWILGLKPQHLQISARLWGMEIFYCISHLFTLPMHKTYILVHTSLCSCCEATLPLDPSEVPPIFVNNRQARFVAYSGLNIPVHVNTAITSWDTMQLRGLSSRCSDTIYALNRTFRNGIAKVYMFLCLLIISRDSHSVPA